MIVLKRATGVLLYQDLGRPGYASMGITPSGAANRSALIAANAALGNAPGAPALEMIGTAEFSTTDSIRIALAGATAHVEGARSLLSGVGGAQVWEVMGGHTFHITSGPRTYVAVRGGFDVPLTLGSASYDTLSGLGPPPLTPGEQLTVGTNLETLRGYEPRPPSSLVSRPAPNVVIASVYPGPRESWITDLDPLFTGEYRISEATDRVGTRVVGPRLERSVLTELPSEGIVRGAIQLPPNGEPVIFGADHPTTGGYPVIGVLAPSSSDALAHVTPGQKIRFRRAAPRG